MVKQFKNDQEALDAAKAILKVEQLNKRYKGKVARQMKLCIKVLEKAVKQAA